MMQLKIELAAAQAGNEPAAPCNNNSSSSWKQHGGSKSPVENGRYSDHTYEGTEVEELTREPNADLPTVGIHKSPESLAGYGILCFSMKCITWDSIGEKPLWLCSRRRSCRLNDQQKSHVLLHCMHAVGCKGLQASRLWEDIDCTCMTCHLPDDIAFPTFSMFLSDVVSQHGYGSGTAILCSSRHP